MGARFSTPIQTGPVAYPASYTMGTGASFPRVKRPGRGVDHPPPSSAKVKAIPLLPVWVFVARSRVNFTFLRKESIEAPGGGRNPTDIRSCTWDELVLVSVSGLMNTTTIADCTNQRF
jgi:hypothetical protein